MTVISDLFEELRKHVGCQYISDMAFDPYNSIAKEKIALMDLHQYPGSVLWDAAQYLYGVDIDFDSAEQVRDFLSNSVKSLD